MHIVQVSLKFIIDRKMQLAANLATSHVILILILILIHGISLQTNLPINTWKGQISTPRTKNIGLVYKKVIGIVNVEENKHG